MQPADLLAVALGFLFVAALSSRAGNNLITAALFLCALLSGFLAAFTVVALIL